MFEKVLGAALAILAGAGSAGGAGMSGGPVYAVKVTLKGRPALVPMQALFLAEYGAWGVGYVMPSGHRKRYNVKGNEGVLSSERQAIGRLQDLAYSRGWKLWPNGKEWKCIYLDKEEKR